MYKFSGDDTITVTISGNISLREIIDMVNVQFSDRNVLVNGVEKSACDVNFGAGDIIVRSSPFMHEKDVMKEMQEKKGKEHIVTPSEPLVLEKEENKEKKEKEDGEEEEETGLEILALRNKKISELEKTTERALNSVQTFQRQHQVLYDRFVSLRVMFDEQKLSLLNTLWIHCGAYHPELSEIPKIENMAIFTESEDRVGEYTVGETLGQGQFATVRSCCKDGTSYELAVKIIKKDRFTTFTALKRISNEIEILRKLKSEFIVSVNDVVQTMDNLYIVTEKGGRDLFEYFYGSPDGVPESWAKEIITCVLKAVLYCHDRDICHRDLKPENILLTFDKDNGKCIDLKVCDFGLSTRFSSSHLLTDFCGSPGFFAPEMIISGSYEGDKADVWSIGCILLELLFGHRRFIDVWMSAYDYEVLQSKTQFTKDIKDTVDELPKSLTFSDPLNDFITQLLILNPKNRPKIRDICHHPWLYGAFETVTAPPKSSSKHKLKKRPSITDAVSQSDSALNVSGGKSKALPKSEEHSKDDSQVVSDDPLSIPGLKFSSAISLPRLQKEKSLLQALDVKEASQSQPVKGTSPRGVAGKTTNLSGKKNVIPSPSSSASATAFGEEGMSEGLNDTALLMKNSSKSMRISFDSMGSEMLGESRRGSEIDLSSRLSKALPPIVDGMNSRVLEGGSTGAHDDGDQMDTDGSSLSALNAHSLVNAAIYSLSKSVAKRVDLPSPQLQSSPPDPEGSSGVNSVGSGSGVSFFGYGNRQYSAPRGSFANDFSAPRGSFANDAYTNPRGSFVSECGGNARSSFFSEAKNSMKEYIIKTSCMPSMSSSVTVSPIGATPLATPTASGTPTLRNIEEEADEMTSIDELRNFLSGGGFSFLGSK